MSENIDDVTGCVHGLVWGCRDCMIDRLTRELDEAVDMQAEERDWAAKWKARATAAEARVRELEADTRGTLLREVATYLRKRGEVHRARASNRGAGPHVLEAHALLLEQAAEGAALEHCPSCDFLLPLDKARCARCGRKGQPVQQWTTPTDPAPEQAGEGKRCPHACIDEHEQPTDESCPFSKPCPVHDAREVRRG